MKMFLSDLDGTLMTAAENRIAFRVLDAISEVQAKNIPFAVASGRAISELWHLFEPLKEKLLFAACDGALIFEGEKLIFEAPIQNLAQFNKEETLLLQGKYITYVKGQNAFVREMKLHYGGHAVEFSDVSEIEEPIYKVVVNKPQYEAQDVNRVYGDTRITEFTAKGIDKGSATAFLLSRYGIDKAEAMAFGDNTNDLPMLRSVENSVAVHNAKYIVQSACKYTTDDVVKTMQEHIQTRTYINKKIPEVERNGEYAAL